MSKISRPIPCDASTYGKRKELIARRTTSAGVAQRAKIILACIGARYCGASAYESRHGEFAAHIEAFTVAYNETARPFVWKKREVKGSQLKNIARNFNN